MKRENQSVDPGVRASGTCRYCKYSGLVLGIGTAGDEAEVLQAKLWEPGETLAAAHKPGSHAPVLTPGSNRML